MLVACRLAGLSALVPHYEGVDARTQSAQSGDESLGVAKARSGLGLGAAAFTGEVVSGQYFGPLGPCEAVWKRNRICQHFGEPA
jgi:hypothetical protein